MESMVSQIYGSLYQCYLTIAIVLVDKVHYEVVHLLMYSRPPPSPQTPQPFPSFPFYIDDLPGKTSNCLPLLTIKL